MNVRLKGNKLILSEAPARDVEGAFLILTPSNEVMMNATKGQKEYEIEGDLTRKNIEAVYLRVL
jgi:hypothetical protein